MKPMISLLALASFTSAAFADGMFEESVDANSDAHISIENISGSITVHAWDKDQVDVSAELIGGATELIVSGSGKRINIEVDYENSHGGGWFGGNKHKDSRAELVVYVPHAAMLNIDSVSADIAVNDTDGEGLDVESVSGDVDLEVNSEEVNVDTVSGDIRLENAKLEELHLESVSGDIYVNGGNVDAQLETVSGDIELENVEIVALYAESVSGDVHFPLNLTESSDIEVETLSGDIRAKGGDNLSARVEVETFSGGIRMPAGKVHKEKYGPGKSYEHTYGNGASRITFNSHSGDVSIK